MTLPDERFRAITQTRKFLYELCDPAKTPGIPKIIRQQAQALLRHYPNDFDMHTACNLAPDVFQTNMEPVTRLIAKWEQGKDKD